MTWWDSRSLRVLALLALLSVVFTGCSSSPDLGVAQAERRESAQRQLPADWMAVSKSDWRYKLLPTKTQAELEQVRVDFQTERQSAGYSFYGGYSEALVSRRLQTNRQADDAFINAYAAQFDYNEAVFRDLTPELMGMSERPSDVERNMAVVGNQNLRMMWGDLGRLWLFDEPSPLSPWTAISTGGQPQ